MRPALLPSLRAALVTASLLAAAVSLWAAPVAAAQPAPGGWPMVGGDPAHTATAAAPAPPYREAWSVEIPGGGAAAGPVVSDTTLVAVGWDRVVALSTEDGSQVWSVSREKGPTGPALVAGDLAVFAEGLGPIGAVVAVEMEDGNEAWRAEVGSAVVGGITPVGDAVVAAGRDGTVRSLDAETGEERWTHEVEGQIETAPAFDGTTVFVVSEDPRAGTGTMHALDPGTGRERWTFTPEGIGAPASSPVVAGGGVVATFGDRVRAVAAGGADRWSHRLRWSASPRLVPAAPGDVIVGDLTGHVYRIDAAAGQERWLFRLPGDLLRGSPVVVGGAVVVGSGTGEVAAIDLERGHLVWRHDLGDGRVTAPAVADGKLFLALHGGSVSAWENDPGGALLDEPSPTTLFLGRALLNYAAVAVPLFILLFGAFRLLGRPRPSAPQPSSMRGEP